MDDRRLETIIGRLLQTGVLAAAATVFAGGALYLVRHHAEPANYHTFAAGSTATRTLSGILLAATHGGGQALIQLGLLLLVLTPIARVGVALVGFLLERDRLYAVVSLIVLLILVFSLMRAT